MYDAIKTLEQIIIIYQPLLDKIDTAYFSLKPLPNKWSKKEILGHLVDSAQNNIRRFIVGQYEDQPHIEYNQNQWVTISDYQHYDEKDLIRFWVLINKHIVRILKNTSSYAAKRLIRTQEIHSIEWLAADYNKHLLHHLHHLLDMEPIPYP